MKGARHPRDTVKTCSMPISTLYSEIDLTILHVNHICAGDEHLAVFRFSKVEEGPEEPVQGQEESGS